MGFGNLVLILISCSWSGVCVFGAVLYSYIFKTETRVFFFLLQQQLPLILFVKINVILKRIPFKEPQYTGVGGYTYMKL